MREKYGKGALGKVLQGLGALGFSMKLPFPSVTVQRLIIRLSHKRLTTFLKKGNQIVIFGKRVTNLEETHRISSLCSDAFSYLQHHERPSRLADQSLHLLAFQIKNTLMEVVNNNDYFWFFLNFLQLHSALNMPFNDTSAGLQWYIVSNGIKLATILSLFYFRNLPISSSLIWCKMWFFSQSACQKLLISLKGQNKKCQFKFHRKLATRMRVFIHI